MKKNKEHVSKSKHPMSAWIDFKHYPDGRIAVGIECDDPSVTFDGHYICTFPRKDNESDSEGAMDRASKVLKYMSGIGQIYRSSIFEEMKHEI